MLESYIAPLFMGYVNKYIKNLRPEDLSLSFWGGDVVLNNLELNLDVLQQELNLPVTFLSGKIYKLQLHVPWTQLIYEPIVVTIDTMEFVIRLKDVGEASSSSHSHSNKSSNQPDSFSSAKLQSVQSEQYTPGYVQGILNKVVNNISFKINNVIVKYVEEDLVFSVNIKSVDLYSADKFWNKAFIELSLPELLLRKVAIVTDLTVCLDQRNPSGKIELYQDPILYRCNLQCRISSHYPTINSLNSIHNILNIFCESVDLSLTDQQLPMVLRLINLIIGLYYGKLDLPGCPDKIHTAPEIIKMSKLKSKVLSVVPSTESSSSWTTWALSMVPGISEASTDQNVNYSLEKEIAVFITNMTITMKKTSQSPKNIITSQRLEFTPVVCIELSSCKLFVKIIDETCFDVQLHIDNIIGYLLRKRCLCQIKTDNEMQDDEPLSQDEVFLKLGSFQHKRNPFMCLKESLFSSLLDADNVKSNIIIDISESPAQVSTNELSNDALKSSENSDLESNFQQEERENLAIFFSYFYEMKLPKFENDSLDNIFLYPETDEILNEVSEKTLTFGQSQIFCSTKVIHLLLWLADIVSIPIPPRREKKGIFLDPFVLKQLQLGNFLTRSFTMTVFGTDIFLLNNDQNCTKQDVDNKHECVSLLFSLGVCKIIKTDPMYPSELESMNLSKNLYNIKNQSCLSSIMNISVTINQACFCILNEDYLDVCHSTSITSQTILEIDIQKSPEVHHNTSSSILKASFSCQNINLSFTKFQIILFSKIVLSWFVQTKNNLKELSETVFSPDKQTTMNIVLERIHANYIDTIDVHAIKCSVDKANATVVNFTDKIASDNTFHNTIFEAPCNSSFSSEQSFWFEKSCDGIVLNEFIDIIIQCNKKTTKLTNTVQLFSLNVSGCCFNFDRSLHQWLLDETVTPNKNQKKFLRKNSKSLNRSVDYGTTGRTGNQKRTKSYARIIGVSSASSHKSKDKELNFESDTGNGFDLAFGDWLALKIDYFKSFHIKIKINPIVFMFPEGQLSHDSLKHNTNILNKFKDMYNSKEAFPSTLVVCFPKLEVTSSSLNKEIFENKLPIIANNVQKETLPWNVTSSNFAILTLMKESENFSNDQIKKYGFYLCKPVSWNLFLAASPISKDSEGSSTLGSILERYPWKKSSAFFDKQLFFGRHAIGFVIHMDWSICELNLSQVQVPFLLKVISSLVETWKFLTSNSLHISHFDVKDNLLFEKVITQDQSSVSSSSAVDHAEALSAMTCSTVPNSKLVNDISISLWIQLTLPKIKFSVCSTLKEENSLYHVTSEINELMFSVDYQDNALEVTTKIGSFTVYYSLMRFDKIPIEGWTLIDQGYLLFQKEDSLFKDSKAFLSVLYKGIYHQLLSISSPLSKSEMNKPSLHVFGSLIHSPDLIFKHDISVHVLKFDIICNMKPIISSLDIVKDILVSNLLEKHVRNQTATLVRNSVFKTDSIIPTPILNIHVDSIRLIFPIGEFKEAKYECIDKKESVFIFHVDLISVSSSPCNPITKTIVCKDAYKRIKKLYRDSLKNIKLWNVQYQVDIKNVVCCTTNWHAIEQNFLDDQGSTQVYGQNPAFEWNCHSEYANTTLTPICSNLDFKITLAPPLRAALKANSMSTWITSAGVDIHSPRGIKMFVNTSQMSLLLQIINDFNIASSEIISILTQNFSLKPNCDDGLDQVSLCSELVNTEIKNNIEKPYEFPPVELFASVCEISFMTYLKHSEQPLTFIIHPVLLLNCGLVNCSLTTNNLPKIQFNIHSLKVLTSSITNGIPSEFPIVAHYDRELFQCGNGYIDHLTGVLPNLCSCSIKLNEERSLEINIDLKKPIYLNITLQYTENIHRFVAEVSRLFQSNSNLSDKNLNVSTQSSGSLYHFINKINLKASMLSFSYSPFTKDSTDNIKLECAYQSFEAELCCISNVSLIKLCNVRCQIQGLEVYLLKNDLKCSIINPFICDLKMVAEFVPHCANESNLSFYPRLSLWANIGILQLTISQQLFDILGKFVYQQNKDEVASIVNKDIEYFGFDLTESEDDLRNGLFYYTFLSVDETREPNENEILFTHENSCGFPTMTWRYSQQRIITELTILPVPFQSNQDSKVKCRLEYYNSLKECFCLYYAFNLSERDTLFCQICDRTSLFSVNNNISSLWRVVICERFENNGVPASSLAVCMKINSVYSSLLIPSLECKVLVSSVEILFENSMTLLGQASPTEIKPFFFESDSFPANCEMVTLHLTKFNIESVVKKSAVVFETEASVSIRVMDFDSFCWIDLMSPSICSVQLIKAISKTFDHTENAICARIGAFNLYVTPNAINTLSMVTKGWIDDKSSEVLIHSHFLICNDTQEDIHVKQVNTEEDLMIHSGQALPYSWYKHDEQLLVFSVAYNGPIVWCEPVTLKDDTVVPRFINYPTHAVDLMVEIKSMQNIKKQITVHGCFSLVNKMDIDLNVQLICSKSEKTVGTFQPQTIGAYQHKVRNANERTNLVSTNIFLPANIVRPSITLSVSLIKSLKVSSVGEDIELTKELEFPLDSNEFQTIMSLDANGSLHCWLTVCRDENIPSIYIVTISPMYVFRNHLPNPVHLKCTQAKFVEELIVTGQANETQVCSLNPDEHFDLSLALFDTLTYSNPALSLRPSLFKTLKCSKLFSDSTFNLYTWPYVSNISINESSQTDPVGRQFVIFLEKSEIIVQASLYWPHLPTVLIDIKPFLLLHNSSLTAVEIGCEGGTLYTLNCKETISLFFLCTNIKIGLRTKNEEILWSSKVQILNNMEPGVPYSKQNLSSELFHQCSIHNSNSSLCYQFIVSCHRQQGIYVVDINERFVVHNFSKHLLKSALSMSDSLAEEKSLNNAAINILPPNSTVPCSVLNKDCMSNQAPGLFINFRVVESNENISFDAFGDASKVLMSKFVIIARESFCLSKEHLRESFILKCSSEKMYSFVATSNLENGVIHIFVDEDTSPVVSIKNKCDIDFYLKELIVAEINKKNYQVLCSNSNKFLCLTKNTSVAFQPKVFKEGFPKANNKIELACQLAILRESCLELSQPIILENHSKVKIFVPNYKEVYICAEVVSSQLCIEMQDCEFQLNLCNSLPFPSLNISFELVNLIVIDQIESKMQSIISASISEIKFIHSVDKNKSLFKLCIGYMQVDNQLKDFCYHFPVVFLPMRELNKRYHSPVANAPFPDIEASLDMDFIMLSFEVNRSLLNENIYLDQVKLIMQPCEMYLEDTFIYRLVGTFSHFLPVTKKGDSSSTPVNNATVISVLRPLHLCNIEIGELSLLISVHASVKVFLSSNHMPVVLGSFRCFPTQTIFKEFVRTLLYHYATQALVQAGWMLGSLEIIGNPTGLLQNFGRGISNFFILPYNGLKEGPASFVSGISQGTSAFLTHISTGTLTSINSFASSMSRNMDRLCFDESHLLMQEKRRAQSIRKSNSFKNAFEGFGMSLLGAIAGIVDHPMQNVTNANNTSEAVSGIMFGFAKGIVGAITKPIGGAMELISQASQQILQGAGLVRTPEKMFNQDIENFNKYESRMKFLWQILHLECLGNVLVVSNVHISEKNAKFTLILTKAVLFVFDTKSGSVNSAFPIKEIKLGCCKVTESYHRLQVRKKRDENHSLTSGSLDENPNFRQFFQSFRSASASSQVEALCESNVSNAELTFDIEPDIANLLLISFQANKNVLEEAASPVDIVDL